MVYQLSRGAIEEICRGGNPASPVLQVLGYKKIPGGPTERYRVLLSDGLHTHSSAMLANQLNPLVNDGELEGFTVIRLDKYVCNDISPDKRVVIVLEVTVLQTSQDCGQKIGNPQAFNKASSGGDAPRTVGVKTEIGPTPAQRPKLEPTSQPPKPNAPPVHSFANLPKQAPATPGGTQLKVHPIVSLTPYQNRWQIRARLTQKTHIRTWSNSRGEGKLFSMNFTDESGEIRATAFNDAVDKYYEMLEVNKVYYISKCTLKTANKQYSSVNNDYEMTFTADTIVTPCVDEADLPAINFNFTPINQIGEAQPGTTLDVIGVVKNAADVTTITTKATGKEVSKRELTLVDKSKTSINITLWGTEAEKYCPDTPNPVMAVKGARVSEFGGRSLSMLMSSQMMWNPDIKEAHALRGWYDCEGSKEDFESFRNEAGSGGYSSTTWKLLSEAKGGNIGLQEKPDYFTVTATVLHFRKENCLYMACPTEACNKKMVDQGNGMYRCEKCNKEFDNYRWRAILSMNIGDFTDNHWITCFQDSAEAVLGITADALGELKLTDEDSYDKVFQDATFRSFNFRVRSKVETYNDESRLKSVCMQATPLDYTEYNKRLVQEIDKLAS